MLHKVSSILFFLLFSISLYSQSGRSGYPLGLLRPELVDQVPAGNIWTGAIPESLNEDFQDPLLISRPVEFNWVPLSQEWIKTDGRWLYLTRLEAPGVGGSGIILEHFDLEDDDRLFIYDAEGKEIHGVFFGRDLKGRQRFFAGLLPGQRWVIEVSRSVASPPQSVPFQVARIDLVPDDKVSALGFDDALPCNINVACPEGDSYRDEEKSVVRILMVLKEGMGWCSGSLMNNTAMDGTPYILTAFHCQDGYTPEYDLWRFDFKYESASCDMPTTEPGKVSYSGALRRAGFRDSDFLLLELTDEIDQGLDVWFNGWNRGTSAPSRAALIHHPAGDIKKISIEEDGVIIQNSSLKWNNGTTTPKGFHFQVILDKGTMEPGSSGGPLFDQDGYVVGQLHGGMADCDTRFLTYHGRLYRSWTGGGTAESRLSDWLDPLGTSPVRFQGIENPNQPQLVSITGRVESSRGVPMANVELQLEGATVSSTLTGQDGSFAFYDMPANGDYSVVPAKDYFAQNGVTAQDISIIRRHLLGITSITDDNALMAADLNNSGSISAADLTPLIRLILGLDQKFAQVPSWKFEPERVNFSQLNADQTDLIIKGIKMGDVNFSADPRL